MIILNKYVIQGSSMSPTFSPGDTVVASSLPYLLTKLKCGDIIVCTDPRNERILIKRIARIRKDEYFVVGDNKAASTDSRQFGFIQRKDIIGKVLYKLSI
jgi:nickel-type superoxide dismutase maturation protease